ncbi:hypothetical protein HETIRDRAFT_105578 [Heterobasidion irregulare TC 32-1]|uniref:Promethin n=1 Tax=Heterobasidion irregulare (strain TC 32-1) TaxID=747525 RepID=W4JUM9_HETIT|nr:uncharacterized protein HETIRDRAFT_105578 [Heterobasidion irregulare TC 32-1]ETW77263.1 hypothetical protein HETIRDRAFT_105578 [Heterobasidion irregulare TC 32-1]
MGTKYGLDDPQGDLATYFEKSATLVRHLFERLEEDYIGPWIQLARESFAAYPIPVTFIAIFASLSFIPIITFVVFSLLIGASFLFFALCVAFTASVSVVLLFAAILLLTLTAIFFISAFFTVSGLTVYLSTRLLLHLRASGLQGLDIWRNEARQIVLHVRSAPVPAEESDEFSDDSAVVIKKEGAETDKLSDADVVYPSATNDAQKNEVYETKDEINA